MPNDYSNLLEKFSKLKILIIGDAMLDIYLWGKVERISPEAPVPVVAVKKRSYSLGGAANVALNLKALGAKPILCSVIGNDQKALDFLAKMKQEQLSTEGILKSPRRLTTSKFRIFGNNYQMLRVDEESTHDLESEDENELRDHIHTIMDNQKIDAVIFQDYNKGVLTRHIIHDIIDGANQRSIPITVDPKKANFKEYKEVTLFKPNLKELREGLKAEISLDQSWEIEYAANILHSEQKVQMVLTTLSDAGVYMSAAESGRNIQRYHIPAHIRSVADVSGAGDTVISVATACLAAGMTPYEIAAISNLAGGLVCEEVGVVPVNKDRLLNEVKLLKIEE